METILEGAPLGFQVQQLLLITVLCRYIRLTGILHNHDNDCGEGLVLLKRHVQILSIFIVEVPIG